LASRTSIKRTVSTLVKSSVFRNKSGNLQQNAILTRDTMNGVLVYVDDNIAKYGALLDAGKVPGIGQQHKGWFSKTAYTKVASWINSDFNDRKSNIASTAETVAQNEPDTTERQITYLRNIRSVK